MKRIHDIKLTFTKEEEEKLERLAKDLGLKKTAYIRMVSLNAKVNFEKNKLK